MTSVREPIADGDTLEGVVSPVDAETDLCATLGRDHLTSAAWPRPRAARRQRQIAAERRQLEPRARTRSSARRGARLAVPPMSTSPPPDTLA